MHHAALCAFALLASFVAIGCGSSDVDFRDRDTSGTGGAAGSGGAPPGGSGGTQAGSAPGGSAGNPQGGAPGGTAGTGGASGESGSAGTASGGTSAGNGGTGPTGGTGNTAFSCGTLMCFREQQLCRTTLPAVPSGPTQYMCQPFPDSCFTTDCSCFCNPPQQSPCGPGSVCTCMDEGLQVRVTCSAP